MPSLLHPEQRSALRRGRLGLRYPADQPIGALVVDQLCLALRTPESVQSVRDRVRGSAIDVDEARVVMRGAWRNW